MDTKGETRTDRKKEETRGKIIVAAMALFHQHGLEAVTMEQIAAEVDIAKGTLYNYYPSKEAIINAAMQRSMQGKTPERLEALRRLPDTRTRLTRLLETLLDGVRAQQEIFEAFMVYRMKQVISFQPPPDEERSGLSAIVIEVMALGQASGELRGDLPLDLLEDFFEFILVETTRPLYLDPEHFDARQSIERCVDLFMNGAGA